MKHIIQKIISKIDMGINQLLNNILHNNRFQQLESSWRGLHYLIMSSNKYPKKLIRIKLLNISWQEISKDLSRASDFDQSQLYLKIHQYEFGQAGGDPFTLLIGDYYLSHQRRNHLEITDIQVLQSIAKISATTFCPFISAISENFLGLNNFNGLARLINLDRIFKNKEYRQWNSLRQEDNSRFIGLTLPKILMREPYAKDHSIKNPLIFIEETNSIEKYLWGNPSYLFAANCLRTFINTGWFIDIRGTPSNSKGGRIDKVIANYFHTDKCRLARKSPVSNYITDHKEKKLTECGFIPITVSEQLGNIAFFECPSIQDTKIKPSITKKEIACIKNKKPTSMIHTILCISRFAHYLKIIARNKIGSFSTPEDCQSYLQNWLHQYTANNSELSEELKIRYPLREAHVSVYEKLGVQGSYCCTINLRPHHQSNQIHSHLEFHSEFIK